MDKQMIVTIPTRLEVYELPIKEALAFLSDDVHCWEFKDMILHNANMRDELRRLGAEKLVEELKGMGVVSEQLGESMDEFVKDWRDEQIADFDINVVRIDEEFTIGDWKINGLKELSSLVEKSYRQFLLLGPKEDTCREVKVEKPREFHVGLAWEDYPMFDSSDYGDNRTYQNYIIREKPIRDEELKDVYKAGRCNLCAITEDTPERLLPLVYYGGDDCFMLVATSVSNRNYIKP